MSRFVLLRHECPPSYQKPSHWDFMIEWQGVLRTWDLRELPSAWAGPIGQPFGKPSPSPSPSVKAIELPDHRLAYLDLEGPLSGGRGTVCRCDHGTYDLLESSDTLIALDLKGHLLRCECRLTRSQDGWLLALQA